MNVIAPDFRTAIADRFDASHELLAVRWLAELSGVVPVDEREIFPGDDLRSGLPKRICDRSSGGSTAAGPIAIASWARAVRGRVHPRVAVVAAGVILTPIVGSPAKAGHYRCRAGVVLAQDGSLIGSVRL